MLPSPQLAPSSYQPQNHQQAGSNTMLPGGRQQQTPMLSASQKHQQQQQAAAMLTAGRQQAAMSPQQAFSSYTLQHPNASSRQLLAPSQHQQTHISNLSASNNHSNLHHSHLQQLQNQNLMFANSHSHSNQNPYHQLQFHLQQQHTYSTLHPQLPPQPPAPMATSQQYNMNSDYSSSTYHVYDQISDLIIIKQQRMERKRQLERRRKLILVSLLAVLLLTGLAFVALQALQWASSSSGQSSSSSLLSSASPQMPPIYLGVPQSPADKQEAPAMAPPLAPQLQPRPSWLQPAGLDPFDGRRFPQAGPRPVWATPAGVEVFDASRQFAPRPAQLPAQLPPPPSPQPAAPTLVQPASGPATTAPTLGQCPPGFYGRLCSFNGCPNNCSQRGQCVRATTTNGSLGGQGASLASSSSSATVTFSEQHAGSFQQQLPVPEWRCSCQPGAGGDDCGLSFERQCDDGIDNDKDGLVDCADSECCGHLSCQNSTLCMKSPDPLDILMRKQPPPPTSSFFQRMQFLIDKFSSQIYSNPKDFNDSRASVIRGRVTYMRQGITGIRVSVVGQPNLGMTLTRDGGYFDLMVNGGGAVVVEFGREPFAGQQRSVRVPWNEIVLMEPVELRLEQPEAALELATRQPGGEPEQEASQPSCSAHNYRLMRPHIVAAPKWNRKLPARQTQRPVPSSSGTRAVILRESAMVQQSIQLPGSSWSPASSAPSQAAKNESVSLVYISSRASEFMSTISVQLTPPALAIQSQDPSSSQQSSQLPQELKLIHLKIVIEGNLFEQLFEAQSNLSFTFAWNRRNVYRQKCFGLSTATVSVGYEYFDCKQIIWTSKTVQVPGHDLSISDVGSQWNFNIHHRYNYRDAILQRGDGHNFYLKANEARLVTTLMGDGFQRLVSCPYCDALPDQRLLKPQALVSAPDGGLYVGDYNMIRRLEPSQGGERLVRTVLELPASRVPSRYALALNHADGNKLHMTDLDHYQIYQVREQTAQQRADNDTLGSSLDDSLSPVVGNGLKCELGDGTSCGDGRSARAARLVEPRALAFDHAGRMYIADGPNVRLVETDGRIYTILGNYAAGRQPTKFPCAPGDTLPLHKFLPHAPQDLAVNPIDETLYLIDDNLVYRITPDKRLQLVAGRPAHCAGAEERPAGARQPQRASELQLQAAQWLAFSQQGDLYVAEDNAKLGMSRVWLISPEEDSARLFAGLDDQLQQQQQQSGELAAASSSERASNALPMQQQQANSKALEHRFGSMAAICVDQTGRLLVADKGQLRILTVEPDLPSMNLAGEYELQSPDNLDELLVFNRHGHHVATRELTGSGSNSLRQQNKYTFTYNVNTSFGQLASISYASGNRISIYRDGPHHSVKMIETSMGGQCKLDIGRHGQVHSISTMGPGSLKTSFSYHVDGGLLRQSRDQLSGEQYEFSYDELGRATGIVHSAPSSAAGTVECRLASSPGSWRAGRSHQALCTSLILAD